MGNYNTSKLNIPERASGKSSDSVDDSAPSNPSSSRFRFGMMLNVFQYLAVRSGSVHSVCGFVGRSQWSLHQSAKHSNINLYVHTFSDKTKMYLTDITLICNETLQYPDGATQQSDPSNIPPVVVELVYIDYDRRPISISRLFLPCM